MRRNDSHTPTQNDTIRQEYRGYLRSRSIEKSLSSLSFQDRHEIYKLLERWFMVNANFGTSIFVSSESNNMMFVNTLVEKNICDQSGAKQMLEQIQHAMSRYCLVRNPELSTGRGENLTIFKYGDFTFTLTTDRMEILRKRGTDEQIMRAALRYAQIFSRSRQWCVGIDLFKKYVALGATIEGFASPFNSQILRLGNYQFCSLFEDVDGKFGSLGSFFKQSFELQYVIANPPRILEVLNETSRFCLERIDNAKCKFSILTPIWEDAKYFQDLSNSKYLILREDLPKEVYYSEDPFTGKILKAKHDMVMWTISSPDYGK